MGVKHDGRGIQRSFRVGLGLRCVEDVRSLEAVLLEDRDRAFDTVHCGRQLVVGNADRADLVGIPAARLHLVDDRLPYGLADLGGGNAHMRNVFQRLAVGADQSIVDRHQLEIVRRSLGDDTRAELDVGCADHKTLNALGAQIVDRRHEFLAVFGPDLHKREAFFLRSLVSELPFVLEPGLLRLLDNETDLHVRRIG